MIALEQTRQHLESLGLKQAAEALDNALDAAAGKQLTYPEMLADLLGVEVNARRKRYLTHEDQARASALPALHRAVRFRLPALRRRAPGQGAGQPRLRGRSH